MRLIVADVSSLILLAKCSLLSTYAERVRLLAPRRVFEEAASAGLREEHPDAEMIARCEKNGLLQIESVRSRRRLPLALAKGEADAIRLFLEKEADLLLSDDARAIKTCRLLDLPFTTTPRVVVDLARARVIETAAARRALEKLAVAGRYSRDILAAALVAIQEERHDDANDDSTS